MNPTDWEPHAGGAGKDARSEWFLSDRYGLTGSEWYAGPHQPRIGGSQNSDDYADLGIVTKRVRMNIFLEARSLGGFLASVPDHLGVDRRITGMPAVAWKQPCAWLAL